MSGFVSLISQHLALPGRLFGLVLFVCLLALGAAFSAEAFFGLEPCRLCVTQRYPFALGAVVALAGLILRAHGKGLHATLFGVLSLNFLTNSGIALYHTGVERHWWPSDELCRLTVTKEGQSLIENILSAPMGRCDEIPWADPLLGLSMANYNVLLCFGLFALCAVCALMAWRRRGETDSPAPL